RASHVRDKALPVRVSLEGVPPGEGRVGLQHGRVHRARRMCHRVQAHREGRDPLELPSRLLRCRVPIRLTRCARGLRLISGVDDKMGVMLAERKPEWLRVRPPAGENYGRLKSLVRSPDLQGDLEPVRSVVDAGVDVLDHNVETVERLQSVVRDRRANYAQSLHVLRGAKGMRDGLFTKSSIMLGLGETREEVLETMGDLRAANVDILTLGQ